MCEMNIFIEVEWARAGKWLLDFVSCCSKTAADENFLCHHKWYHYGAILRLNVCIILPCLGEKEKRRRVMEASREMERWMNRKVGMVLLLKYSGWWLPLRTRKSCFGAVNFELSKKSFFWAIGQVQIFMMILFAWLCQKLSNFLIVFGALGKLSNWRKNACWAARELLKNIKSFQIFKSFKLN